jgi:uncharacterized membrane protein YphA (DoxX/SURF4 family)
MKFLENRVVVITLRWALAAVFIYAGITKLGSPQSFSDSISSFSIIPNYGINLMSLGLPPFEIIAGLAIVSGIQRRPAILGLLTLTSIFMIALGSAIVRGIPVDCGCFGSGKPSVFGSWMSFGRDIPILAVAILLYLSECRREEAAVQEIAIPEA